MFQKFCGRYRKFFQEINEATLLFVRIASKICIVFFYENFKWCFFIMFEPFLNIACPVTKKRLK